MSWDWKKLDPRTWWDKGKRFLVEVRTEVSKASFPSREEVIATTTVVLIASVIFAIYLWVIDVAIMRSYQWIVGKLAS